MSKVVHQPLLVLAALLMGLGCATPTAEPQGTRASAATSPDLEDWELAAHRDTTGAYARFIEQHPDSDLIRQAEARLDDLVWQQADGTGTVGSYRAYLQAAAAEFWRKLGPHEIRLPGNHVDAARVRLAQEKQRLAALDFDPRWLIHRAQSGLREWGYPEVDVDGAWGATTRGAVAAFQSARHLPETGLLDEATKQALGMERAESAAESTTDSTELSQPSRATPLSVGPARLRSYGKLVRIGPRRMHLTSAPEGTKVFSLSGKPVVRRPGTAQRLSLADLAAGQLVRVDYLPDTPGLRISSGRGSGRARKAKSIPLRAERIWLLP